jgi:hypothetical protein
MSSKRITVFGLSLLTASTFSPAQIGVETDAGSGTVFQARNTGSLGLDGYGFKAESKPQPYYGIALFADGGWKGVVATASQAGTGSRYGGDFAAYGGASANYGIYAYSPSGLSNYAGYFAGNVHVSGTFTNPSDERLKKDVRALNGSLSKVMYLRPATYYFDNSTLPVEGLAQGRQIGLMAGDVSQVLPELVHQVLVPKRGEAKKEAGAHEETFQSVNYIGLIPVLVGAIQEQQRAIQEQQAEIKALKAALGK